MICVMGIIPMECVENTYVRRCMCVNVRSSADGMIACCEYMTELLQDLFMLVCC